MTSLLAAAGHKRAGVKVPAPRLADLADDLAEQIRDELEALGGDGDAAAGLRPNSWDLALDGGLLVELDEELHFNRYRRQTLQAPWAQALPWTDPYLEYCNAEEERCLAVASGDSDGPTHHASTCSAPPPNPVTSTAEVPQGGSSAPRTTQSKDPSLRASPSTASLACLCTTQSTARRWSRQLRTMSARELGRRVVLEHADRLQLPSKGWPWPRGWPDTSTSPTIITPNPRCLHPDDRPYRRLFGPPRLGPQR